VDATFSGRSAARDGAAPDPAAALALAGDGLPPSPELVLVSPPEVAALARLLLPEPGSFGRLPGPGPPREPAPAPPAPAVAATPPRGPGRRVLLAVATLAAAAAAAGFAATPALDWSRGRDGAAPPPSAAAPTFGTKGATAAGVAGEAAGPARREPLGPAAARTFAWVPVPRASAYLVTFSRDGATVLRRRVAGTRLELPAGFELRRGTYRWRVVPLGRDGSERGPAIVDATFAVASPAPG